MAWPHLYKDYQYNITLGEFKSEKGGIFLEQLCHGLQAKIWNHSETYPADVLVSIHCLKYSVETVLLKVHSLELYPLQGVLGVRQQGLSKEETRLLLHLGLWEVQLGDVRAREVSWGENLRDIECTQIGKLDISLEIEGPLEFAITWLESACKTLNLCVCQLLWVIALVV